MVRRSVVGVVLVCACLLRRTSWIVLHCEGWLTCLKRLWTHLAHYKRTVDARNVLRLVARLLKGELAMENMDYRVEGMEHMVVNLLMCVVIFFEERRCV